ncbi:MAG: hypothetical protein AABX28_02910 [Nanoarchaeota archaeon]
MMKFPAKSKFGGETTFLWFGWKDLEDIILNPLNEEWYYNLSREHKEKIEEKRKGIEEKGGWDAPKWRTEKVYEKVIQGVEKLVVDVSPIYYSYHIGLRDERNKPLDFYANPITINAVQETTDGKILLARRGKLSDQKGLCLVGSGFIERSESEGELLLPEKVGYTVLTECIEETEYPKRKAIFNMSYARAMAVVFGSNHDSTFSVYMPLLVDSSEVALKGGGEHDDLLPLPSSPEDIQDVIRQRGYKGILANDHMLGSLEAYLYNRNNIVNLRKEMNLKTYGKRTFKEKIKEKVGEFVRGQPNYFNPEEEKEGL